MEKSAEGLVQDATKPTTDLQNGVANSLGVRPETVNPEDESLLEKAQAVAHAMGSTVGEKIGGEGTRIEVMASKKPSLISRVRKMKLWK